MKHKIRIAFISLVGLFFLVATSFIFLEYRNSEIPEYECKSVQGIITVVNIGGVKDVTFKLANNKTCFYINRGLDNKFHLDELRNKLVGKNANIFYHDYVNILSGKNPSKQIRKLIIDNDVFYSEY